MTVETKRIYKIAESDFYGITQGTRPVLDEQGDITGYLQNPVATIKYDNRLIVVEPYQVEFREEQGSVDIEKEYTYLKGYSDWLEETLNEKENKGVSYDADGNIKSIESISGAIRDYAMFLGDESMVCSFTKGDEGNRALTITWKEA